MNKVKMLDMSFGKHEVWGHSYTLTENEIKAVRKKAYIRRFDIAFRREVAQDIEEDIAGALHKKFPHLNIIGENREIVDSYLDTLKGLNKNQIFSVLAAHNKQAKKMGVKHVTLEGSREVLIVKIAKLRSKGVKLPEEIQAEDDAKPTGFIDPIKQEEAEKRMKLLSKRKEELLKIGMDELDIVILRKNIIGMTDEEYGLYSQSVKNISKIAAKPVHEKTQADICDYIIVETFGKQTELGKDDIQYHKGNVLKAIDSGIEVPDEVLADYPDIIVPTPENKDNEGVPFPTGLGEGEKSEVRGQEGEKDKE